MLFYLNQLKNSIVEPLIGDGLKRYQGRLEQKLQSENDFNEYYAAEVEKVRLCFDAPKQPFRVNYVAQDSQKSAETLALKM